MSTAHGVVSGNSVTLETIATPRRIPFDAPWNWLAAGWRDMWAMPGISLTYGACFAIAAAALAVLLLEIGAPSLFPVLIGGFLLIGPLVAVGLYEASRRHADGKAARLGEVVAAGLGARGQLMFFGAVLLFTFMIWMQIAILLLMLFLGDAGLPPPEQFMHTLLFTNRGLGLLIVGTAVGGLIAGMVFAIAAVAVPLLLVAQVDAVTAARASISAVTLNPKPMMLWAALIVCLMAAGFATLLVGLVLVFPLIGHATWHAFQDIYGKGVPG